MSKPILDTVQEEFYSVNYESEIPLMIQLHGYQQSFKSDIYQSWNSGKQNVLGVLPTGGGKSVVVSDIALDGYQINMPQAIIAHRNELVSQMSLHVAERGIFHRIIGPDTTISQITRQHRAQFGRSFLNPSAPSAVVGVDTLMHRADSLKDWAGQVQRWVIDEAHHVIRNNKWGRAVDLFPRAHGLGVTACPKRADGQGLGRNFDGVFDSLILGPDMRQLIELGNLSDYEIVCPTSDIDVGEDDIGASGDYAPAKLKVAAKKSRIVGDVVSAYCRYAMGKRAICFATDVETGGKIAASFVSAGIRAVCLSADTPAAQRERYIAEFRAGNIWVLVNVDLFDEGFDVPACDCVIMARPTASLNKYRQMVGRGLRKFLGKLYGLIIDHVSNVLRHGLPDKFIHWTLGRADKRGKQLKDPDDLPLTVCKSCTKPYERYHPICPYCGATPPLPSPRERSIEMVDGDLTLLDRAKLEAMRKAAEIETPGNVAIRVSHVAGDFAGRGAMNKQIDKIEAHSRLSNVIAQWAAVQRLKGFTDPQLYRKFFLTTGIDVLSALDGKLPRQHFDELATRVEQWYTHANQA